MSVKWSIIKVLICFLLVCSSAGYAQEVNTITIEPRRIFRDTVIIMKHDTVWLEKEKVKIDSTDISNKRSSRYDKRVHRYRKHWESLIPTHTKLQYAGNMGLLFWVQDGIMENGINGRRISFSEFYLNTTPNVPKSP